MESCCDKKGKTQLLQASLYSVFLALHGNMSRSCSSSIATMRKKPENHRNNPDTTYLLNQHQCLPPPDVFKKHIYLFNLFIFREKGKKGETEGENINVWLPLECPLLGTWPTTQSCALTENGTGYPLVHRLVLSPLSHTNQADILLSRKICSNVFRPLWLVQPNASLIVTSSKESSLCYNSTNHMFT